MTWHGAEARKAIRKGTVRGLLKWANLVLQESQQIVPIDEATLERSGVASVDPVNLEGAVSYDTPYAVVQHEDFSLMHAPGRQAKYLEVPWLANRDLAAPMIAREVRRETGG